MVRPDDTLDELLKTHPDILDEFARNHPVIHRILENTQNFHVAPRITWEMVAQMTDVSIDELMDKIYRRLGLQWQTTGQKSSYSNSAVESDFEGRKPVELDVRPLVLDGVDPFKQINRALSALKQDEYLELVNVFEPVPLYEYLNRRGYVWSSAKEGSDWRVKIAQGFIESRNKAEMGEVSYVDADRELLNQIFYVVEKASPERYCELDVRDLPSPEPLARIMECFRQEPPPLVVRVLHRRKPDLLLKVAAEHGMSVSAYEENGCTYVYIYSASLLNDGKARDPGV